MPRPEEQGGTLATDTYTYTHGGFTYTKTYILPLETELILKRTFDKPGQEYRLAMAMDISAFWILKRMIG